MKTCIIVLGMHRSGTSALTGTLEKIGIMLPQDLWPAQEDNPKGFFEGQKVIELNERLLAANGSNYDDTRFNTKISEESIAQHLGETKSFLQEEFSYSKYFALKDPRMCITFPLWERALLELGIEIKVVIPYRNPFEVSRSLKKRNNFSTEKSLLLWAKHLLLAEKYSRKYKRHFISFNSLMNNTADSLPELAKFAGVELSQSSVTTVQEQFLDPTLKHHNLDINNVAENIPDFIRKLILFTQKQRFANVTKKEWNTIFNEVTTLYQFFHTYDVQFQSHISRDLHAQRDQASDQAQSFKKQLAQQAELNQSHIVDLESEKDSLLARINQLEKEVEQLRSVQEQLSALEQSYAQQVEQSQSQIQSLKSEKDQLLERQSQLEQEAEQLLQDLDSIKEAKQAQKTEQQSQIDCLSAEKSALYEETQRLVQQLKEQEQTADQTLQDREQQLRAVQEQNEVQIEILKQKNDQLLERQSQLEQEAEQLLQDLDSIKEAKQTQKDELQSHIDRLSKEKAALHEKSHKQEQQLMEQARVSEQALQEKDQKLSDLEQSYTQQIKQSQAKIDALESENSELLKIKDELSQEVSSLTESIDTVVQDLDILKKQKKSSRIYSILGFSKALKRK